MALTESTMLSLSTTAPPFTLPDTEGKSVSLGDVKGEKATLVMFICNHCPYVKHVAPQLAQLGKDHASQGVGIVAISSNDAANYPEDSPAKMKEERASRGYTFAYLYDESQQIAKAYTASCTPDFFLFDGGLKLVYRGQLDATRPSRVSSADHANTPTGCDLRAAIDAVRSGQPVTKEQRPSLGCNIKWKAGGEPAYFG